MKHNIFYKSILFIAVPVLLQSCFAAKEYTRPDMDNEALYRTDHLMADSISMAEISWKDLFMDPLLQDHIEKALTNNLDIRIALKNIDAAQAYLKQGRAGHYPTLDAAAIYSRAENSKNGRLGGGTAEQYELSASLSWEADIWGKIRSSARASNASYLQTVAAHQAIKTDLVAAIATTYLQLMGLDKQRKVITEAVEARRSSLETTIALKGAGQVTEVAVKQTEAQLYTTEVILIDIDTDIKLLENTFSILLGESVQEIHRNSLDQQQLDIPLSTGVPADLLTNRPDVLEAEFGLINAFELTNVARSNFYPSLRLTASGGFQSLELDNWLDAGSLFSSLAASLAQPLLNGRKIRTQHEVSKARQEQALLNYKKTLLIAGKEVSDALYSYGAESNKIGMREKELQANTLAETYSEQLLNNGMANYLEVLTARQNALNSELNLISAQLGQMNAVIALYEALGGGWR